MHIRFIHTSFKGLGSVRLLICLAIQINEYIQQGCIKLFKTDNKGIYYKIFPFLINATLKNP